MHDVAQLEHERRRRDLHLAAVQGERVDDRAHAVPVLLDVLDRAGERGAATTVLVRVAGAAQGAGEHARGGDAVHEAQQHLRRRAEQAVDGEDPAAGVVALEPLQRPAQVDRAVRACLQVSGQHDLVDRSRGDPGDCLSDGGHPLGTGDPPVGVDDRRGRPGGSALGKGGRREAGDADRGPPPRAVAVADHDLGDDERGGAGRRVEGERSERDQAGAGQADLVLDVGGGDQRVPPGLRLGEPARTGQLQAGGGTPADQALAVLHPRQRAVLGQQLQQPTTAHLLGVQAHRGDGEQGLRRGREHTPA